MLDYLAYMESVRWMREFSLDQGREDRWNGIPARPRRASRSSLRHGLALALRDMAARLDPVPA